MGATILYLRDDIPSKLLNTCDIPRGHEAMFNEITIRTSKWLIIVGYKPPKRDIANVLNCISKGIDKHLARYENIIILGDFNSEVRETHMENFCKMYNLNNLIDEPTCFKSAENPSSIDVLLTNSRKSFENNTTLVPIVILYRKFKDMNEERFKDDLCLLKSQ